VVAVDSLRASSWKSANEIFYTARGVVSGQVLYLQVDAGGTVR
jgi:hypothetical protein